MEETFEEGSKEETFTLSDTEIQSIEESIEKGDGKVVETAISNLSASDCAELLSKVSDDNRQIILTQHVSAITPDAYLELDPELCKEALEEMEAPQVANLISTFENDDALDVFENLEPEFQKEVLDQLPIKTRLTVEEGLSFPENSAGRLMNRKFVAVPKYWTVGEAMVFLREPSDDFPETFSEIFIVTSTAQVVGTVALSRILQAGRQIKLETLVDEEVHSISATIDQEEVAQLFRREDLLSAAVVDAEGRMLGVIMIDDVVDVIDQEAQDDILQLAGVKESSIYRDVISTSVSRFGWLFVNLFTAILASAIISLFDSTIEKVVALAILMPIVTSMGGNAGTQALTVVVRALAMREVSNINALRVVWKETMVCFLNGIAFAVIVGLVTFFWFEDVKLGGIIAVAMIVNMFVAGLCGAGIPIFLNKIGSDPAVSSTVLLTTVTDVIGFFVFLGLAATFLL